MVTIHSNFHQSVALFLTPSNTIPHYTSPYYIRMAAERFFPKYFLHIFHLQYANYSSPPSVWGHHKSAEKQTCQLCIQLQSCHVSLRNMGSQILKRKSQEILCKRIHVIQRRNCEVYVIKWDRNTMLRLTAMAFWNCNHRVHGIWWHDICLPKWSKEWLWSVRMCWVRYSF